MIVTTSATGEIGPSGGRVGTFDESQFLVVMIEGQKTYFAVDCDKTAGFVEHPPGAAERRSAGAGVSRAYSSFLAKRAPPRGRRRRTPQPQRKQRLARAAALVPSPADDDDATSGMGMGSDDDDEDLYALVAAETHRRRLYVQSPTETPTGGLRRCGRSCWADDPDDEPT